MKAVISVIVPVCNSDDFLSRCLESVLKQTFKSFELICVSDGASEGCKKILEDYARLDSRIKVIEQVNQGAAVARNMGLSLATGAYIYYLDSDDIIHPQLLEYTYYLAQRYDAELVCFDWAKIPSGQAPKVETLSAFENYPVCQPSMPLRHLQKKGPFKIGFNAWSKLYRRRLAEKVRFLPGNKVEDVPHTVCALRDHPRTVITSATLYYYTIRHDSVSGNSCPVKKIEDYHEGLLAIVRYYARSADAGSEKNTLSWLRKHIIQNVLKQQYNQILRLPRNNRVPALERFKKELRDLEHQELLCWQDYTVKYFFKYYLRYRWLLLGAP